MTLRKPLAPPRRVLGAAVLALAMLTGSSHAATVAASCARRRLRSCTRGSSRSPPTRLPTPYFENNKPQRQGFESAVAYAIAGRLGFSVSQVR